MFDFKNANDAQRQAISSVEGPLLITAGPGTGKTFTLVQRAIYLIQMTYIMYKGSDIMSKKILEDVPDDYIEKTKPNLLI